MRKDGAATHGKRPVKALKSKTASGLSVVGIARNNAYDGRRGGALETQLELETGSRDYNISTGNRHQISGTPR